MSNERFGRAVLDLHRLSGSLVEGLDVFLESDGLDIVPVQRLEVVITFGAELDEFLSNGGTNQHLLARRSVSTILTYLDPFETTGSVGRRGHTELVTLCLQRRHVLLPDGNSVFGGDVGLRDLVGPERQLGNQYAMQETPEGLENLLVEEQHGLNVGTPAVDSVPPVAVCVLSSPHHGREFETKSIGLGTSVRAPSVVPGKEQCQ